MPDFAPPKLPVFQRPTFQDLFMQFAHGLSMRSTCLRLHVGCVIVSHDNTQVFGVGYNGNAHGLPHECDSPEPGKCGCLHAEENAIIHCTQARDVPKVVYTTHLPCMMCAKRIIQLGGVQRVIYDQDYRDHSSVRLLESVGIAIHR